MRRAALAFVSTVAALVLLLSFKTHATGTPHVTATHSTATTGTAASTGSTGSTGSTATGTKTVTGAAADTRYGPVQVQITITDGKITSAQATEYPENDPRDEQINAYAVPILNQEAEQAGSASIDSVSGATYTSDGYLQSLQSALDQAGT